MAAPVVGVQGLDEIQRNKGGIGSVLESRVSDNIIVHHMVVVQRKMSEKSIEVEVNIHQHATDFGHEPIEEGSSSDLTPRKSEKFSNCKEQEDLEAGPDHFFVELCPDRKKYEMEKIELAWQYDGNYMKVELFSVCSDHEGPVREEEPDPGGTLSDPRDQSIVGGQIGSNDGVQDAEEAFADELIQSLSQKSHVNCQLHAGACCCSNISASNHLMGRIIAPVTLSCGLGKKKSKDFRMETISGLPETTGSAGSKMEPVRVQ